MTNAKVKLICPGKSDLSRLRKTILDKYIPTIRNKITLELIQTKLAGFQNST